MHERVAKDWKSWKPHLIKSWRKRFSEREDALKDFHPMDTVVTFNDHMTLSLGGKVFELIYVNDKYNPGDIGVWLPQSGVLHAGFVGYKERHPDIRPDYSHGTTWGMLKQLEAFIPLQPKFVVPGHGPISDTKDLKKYRLHGDAQLRDFVLSDLHIDYAETVIDYKEGILTMPTLKGRLPPDPTVKDKVPATFTGKASLQVEPLGDLTFDVAFDRLPLSRSVPSSENLKRD